MKKLLYLMIGFSLISCSIHKKVDKTKETTSTHTETATTRTITEQLDTNLVFEEDSVKGEKPASEVLDGKPLVTEDENTRTEVSYDPATGNLKSKTVSKPKTVPVHINKTTTEKENKTVREKKTVVEKHKDKEVESWFNWNYLWLIVAAVLFYTWWRYFR